jgi:sugar phosphate isomerase/epimerase
VDRLNVSRYSRRSFGKVALAGLSSMYLAAEDKHGVVNGVRIGIQTYCFRDFEPAVRNLAPEDPGHEKVLNRVLATMTELGVRECELWAPHIAPGSMTGMLVSIRGMDPDGVYGPKPDPSMPLLEEGRKWHLSAPLEYFKNMRKRFQAAGVVIYAYNCGWFGTPQEIDRSFEQAKALGARCITLSGTVSLARKLAPYADRRQFIVAMHPHSQINDPEQFATPESLAAPLQWSKYIWINLDIGHFTAGGFDAVAFIEKHHDRITNLHVKDRKKNNGPNVPWGQGDTPIKQVMQLLKTKKYPIPAYVELEYPIPAGSNSIAETKKCLDYMKAALA